MRSSSLATDDTRAVLARTALGVAMSELIILVPLATRVAFGALRPGQTAVLAAFSLFFVASSMSTMTLVFRALVRRGGGELRALVVASFAGLCSSVLFSIPWIPLIRRNPEIFQSFPGEPTSAQYILVTGFTDAMVVALCWAGVVLYPSAREAALERDRALQALATETELLRLRAHLEPHFVLNTLNAIAAMVVDEPKTSREMLGALGDLFRDATSDRSTERHTVKDEFSWLDRYASIIRARYGEGLRFEWEPLAAPVAQMLLPRLILQPLIENAVQHGATRRAGDGCVRIRARSEGGALVCEIEDNGPGLAKGPRRPGASGLSIVERRLALEAPASSLVLLPGTAGGTLARLVVTQPRSERPRTEGA